MIGFVGHLYGVEALHRIGPYNSLALPSTIGFILLGAGIFAALPAEEPVVILIRNTSGSILLRRLAGLFILLPLVLGWLCIRGAQFGYFDLPFGTAVFATLKIIERHSGTIWLESRPGMGTTFYFTLQPPSGAGSETALSVGSN